MATFNTLPDNVKSIIYSYDGTYHKLYHKVIMEFHKLKEIEHCSHDTKNPKIEDIAVRSSNFNIFRRIKQQHNKYLSKQMYKMTQKNMMYINFPKKKHYIDIVDHPY